VKSKPGPSDDPAGSARRTGGAAQGGTAQGPAGVPQDEPLFITLRDVELPPPVTASRPGDEGLVQSDAELQSVPWLGDPEAERAEQRAARRAQVRRDRFRAAADAARSEPAAPQVLVLDADPASSGPLCELLQGFGFEVVVLPEMPIQPAPWPYVAIFVDAARTAPDGVDGIDLCKQVRELSRAPGGTTPVLVLVTQPLKPVDRVRAQLAGCDETVYKPWARGSVARVLDARGIALPSDARRA
jgi:CheY-like chemotaxis protein